MDQRSDDPLVTMVDLRRNGFCVREARKLFAAHGHDFNDFVRHGLPASVADSWNDLHADKCAASARERARNG